MQQLTENNTTQAVTIAAVTSSKNDDVNTFIAEVEKHIKNGVTAVHIDCAPLLRVTSRNIYALWQARECCLKYNRELILENVSIGLHRVLEALDLAELFFQEYKCESNMQIDIKPNIENIDEAMSTIVGFLLKGGVPEVTAFELQTIFYEIATNIRRHGELHPEQVFKLEIEIEEKQVTFNFTDNGVAFDPTGHDPNIDFYKAVKDQQRSGFGLAMIERLSDSLKYVRSGNNENCITVKKVW